MSKTLYVTGTPIGNLSDFSPRAIEILQSVDFIAAEDTRVTLKLLNHFGIKKELVSCHEHNIRERCSWITDRLLKGEDAAIVTDAGMPCISDPGEELVRQCHEKGIAVRSVPGPSALIAALSISGQNTSRFSFEGFLSTTKKNRFAHLEQVKESPYTLIFYEAPHKLRKTLRDMFQVLGDRPLTVVRELTKIHEETWVTSLQEAAVYYRDHTPIGEFVLILAGATPPSLEEEITLEEAVELARRLQEEDDLSPSEAAKNAASQTPFKRSEIYSQLIANE